jgi:hypothetical protein
VYQYSSMAAIFSFHESGKGLPCFWRRLWVHGLLGLRYLWKQGARFVSLQNSWTRRTHTSPWPSPLPSDGRGEGIRLRRSYDGTGSRRMPTVAWTSSHLKTARGESPFRRRFRLTGAAFHGIKFGRRSEFDWRQSRGRLVVNNSWTRVNMLS